MCWHSIAAAARRRTFVHVAQTRRTFGDQQRRDTKCIRITPLCARTPSSERAQVAVVEMKVKWSTTTGGFVFPSAAAGCCVCVKTVTTFNIYTHVQTHARETAVDVTGDPKAGTRARFAHVLNHDDPILVFGVRQICVFCLSAHLAPPNLIGRTCAASVDVRACVCVCGCTQTGLVIAAANTRD